MKKLKLFMPVVAFALAITGAFALSSFDTAHMPEEEVFGVTARIPSNCNACTTIEACNTTGTDLCTCIGVSEVYKDDGNCDTTLTWDDPAK